MKSGIVASFSLIFLLTLGTTNTYAQKDKELGVMLGAMQYTGDLIEVDGFDPQSFGGGLLFRYYFYPRLNFKANLLYGYVSASDANNPSTFTRNLSFKSHILDVSTQLEINIMPFISGHKRRNWAPYIFGGIAFFNFNPKADYMGTWVELQPLGTEGQGTQYGTAKYKLTAFSIPYGIGFKYGFKPPRFYGKRMNLEGWNLGVELSQRKTFTDHIDDVGGFYPQSLSIFTGVNADLSKTLCDRAPEEGYAPRVVEGSKTQKRGSTEYKDYYMWYGITITRTFRPSRCYGF
jgi:hypothetical protein